LGGENEAARTAAQACLHTALSEVLVLLHPIMPFVTQEIWSCLPGREDWATQPNLAAEASPPTRPEHLHPQSLRTCP
jgi:valyl-tRNA synthetase